MANSAESAIKVGCLALSTLDILNPHTGAARARNLDMQTDLERRAERMTALMEVLATVGLVVAGVALIILASAGGYALICLGRARVLEQQCLLVEARQRQEGQLITFPGASPSDEAA